MDKFYQISTLNALMLGDFYGTISVNEILKYGNTGIGTFEGLDGEMIILDGKAYNGKASGNVEEYGGDKKIAFAAVSEISKDAESYTLKNISDLKQLRNRLDKLIDNKNIFYILKADVDLNSVKVRSCYKQEEPYKTLLEVSSSQMEYSYEECSGYLVGVWCPKYADSLNMPGWHLHFLSGDRTKGGHLLEISIKKADIKIDSKNDYEIILPSDRKFKSLNLSADLKNDVKKVEG